MLTNLDRTIQQRLKLSPREIAAFCQQGQIVEMSLFGSALGDEFRADSDIDLLISFAPNARQGLLTLARIKHELETRLGRQVDLVPKPSLENSDNWLRREEILQRARGIYEQR